MLSQRSRQSRRGGVNTQTLIMIGLAVAVLAITFLLGALLSNRGNAPAAQTSPAANRPANADPAPQQAPPAPQTPSASQPPAMASMPPVRLDPAIIDVGLMRPQTKVDVTTRIINTSNQPLKITASRASCSCTAVDMSGTIIPAGGSVPLVAKFDSQMTLGPKNSAVRLSFEGYEQLVEVRITAEVGLPVRALPAFINALENTSGVYVVESEDKAPFRILTVDGGEPPFVGFDPDTDAPRNHYTLRWDVNDYNASTCLNSKGIKMRPWVLVETDHPDCRLLDISVRHECTRRDLAQGQPWFIADRRAMLGQIDPYAPQEFVITVRWLQHSSPSDRIVAASTASDQFDVQLVSTERRNTDGECLIRMTPKPGVHGPIYGDVSLVAAGGRIETFTVIAYAADKP